MKLPPPNTPRGAILRAHSCDGDPETAARLRAEVSPRFRGIFDRVLAKRPHVEVVANALKKRPGISELMAIGLGLRVDEAPASDKRPADEPPVPPSTLRPPPSNES